MKILDRKKIEKIYKIMGLLDGENLEKSPKYIVKFISVFDHWLSKEEHCLEDKIFFYQKAIETNSTLATTQYFEHHDNLLKFYLDLYNQTKVHGVLAAEYSGSSALVEYDDIKEYEAHILLSIREQLFIKIYIPKFFAIIKENFDLKHLLYVLKSKKKIAEKIYEFVASNNLFILE